MTPLPAPAPLLPRPPCRTAGEPLSPVRALPRAAHVPAPTLMRGHARPAPAPAHAHWRPSPARAHAPRAARSPAHTPRLGLHASGEWTGGTVGALGPFPTRRAPSNHLNLESQRERRVRRPRATGHHFPLIPPLVAPGRQGRERT